MKKCPYCAEEIQDEAIVCKHCGRELVHIATAEETLDLKRATVLDQAVSDYQNKGWVLLSKVGGVVQLKKPKKFNWLWFILWTAASWFAAFMGALVYILYYAVKKEKIIVLSTDNQGVLLLNGEIFTPLSKPIIKPQTPEEIERQKKSTQQALIYIGIAILVIIVIAVIASSSR